MGSGLACLPSGGTSQFIAYNRLFYFPLISTVVVWSVVGNMFSTTASK